MNVKKSEIPNNVYLDQNILDLLVKNKFNDLKGLLQKDEYQLIYTFITFDEISRINNEKYRLNFLELLDELNAFYFWIDQDGKSYFNMKNASKLYDEHILDKEQTELAQHSMEQFLFKLFGGRKGENFSTVLNEQIDALDGIFNDLSESINDLDESSEIVNKAILLYTKFLIENSKRNILKLNRKYDDCIPNSEEYDGIKQFRELTGIGPLQLNNLKSPNIIKQIWQIIKHKFPDDLNNTTLESFLGKMTKNSTIESLNIINKIPALFSFLNIVGYYSDKNINVERKFYSSWSDLLHAQYGAYANLLFSGDKRFVKKTIAVYEYLGIGTKLFFIERK